MDDGPSTLPILTPLLFLRPAPRNNSLFLSHEQKKIQGRGENSSCIPLDPALLLSFACENEETAAMATCAAAMATCAPLSERMARKSHAAYCVGSRSTPRASTSM
ncbi:hypothetical protein SEVIR_7G078601v4 [Setaria viridis]